MENAGGVAVTEKLLEPVLACRPNITAVGRRRRRRGAVVALAFDGFLFAALVLGHASAATRLIIFLPVAAAAVVGLQARRGTCVAMAAMARREHDDGSSEPVDADSARASRRVARTIYRDAALLGAVAAVVAAATAFIG